MNIIYASEYLDHIEYAQIRKLTESGHNITVLTGELAFVQDLKENKIDVFYFSHMSQSRWNKKLQNEIENVLDHTSAEAIYTVHGNKITSNLRAVLSKPQYKKISFLTYRGIIGNTSWHKNPESLLTFNHPRVDGVLGTSEAVKNYLREQYFLKSKYLGVMYPGVSLKYLEERASENISDFKTEAGKLSLCVLGIDRKSKGFKYLVEALDKMSSELSSMIKVYYIGDAKEWVSLLQNDDRYAFLGFKKNPWSYFKHFDFMVMPSLQEGLGRASVEASALKLPVIASTAGGLPEVVKDNETGFLFEKCDSDGLAKVLEKLLALKEEGWKQKSEELGAKAYLRVVDVFTDKVAANNLLSHLQKLKNVK